MTQGGQIMTLGSEVVSKEYQSVVLVHLFRVSSHPMEASNCSPKASKQFDISPKAQFFDPKLSSQITFQWPKSSLQKPRYALSSPKISLCKPQITLCNLQNIFHRPLVAFNKPQAIAHTLYTPHHPLEAPCYPLMAQNHHLEDSCHPLGTHTN